MTNITIENVQSFPGFGVGAIGKTEFSQDYVNMARSAINNGWRHFDTAEVYKSSTELGITLAEFIPNKIPRSQFFITTKLAAESANGDIEGALRDELKKLQLDYVDLYLIHNPFLPKDVKIEHVWAQMEALQAKGLTKYIGVSNFGVREIEKVVAIAKVKPVVNQIEMHPYLYTEELALLETAKKHNILIAAYSPLVSLGRHRAGPLPAVAEKIGAKHSVSDAQVLLKWQLQKGHIVITNSSNPERQRQQLDLKGFELDAKDIKEIEEVGASYPYRFFGWGAFAKEYKGTFVDNE